MRKFGLYFMVFGIFFIAFDKVGSNIVNANLGDYYAKNFNEVTEVGEKVVYKTMLNDTIVYYVTVFDNDHYITYANAYVSTSEEYFKLYDVVVRDIVNYDYANLMIKYVVGEGTGTYDNYMENFSLINSSTDYKLIY